jgi:hypothetical protein
MARGGIGVASRTKTPRARLVPKRCGERRRESARKGLDENWMLGPGWAYGQEVASGGYILSEK